MKLTISYQTQHLPPPYSFAAVFECIIDHEVNINFQQEYLGRDDMDDQEIIAEGFTLNDDFQWAGSIGSNWTEPLTELAETTFQSEPTNDSYIHISIDGRSKGFPVNPQEAEIMVQELIQAVFEKGEKEAPLLMEILHEKHKYLLEWKFGERLFSLNGMDQQWHDGQKIMELVYSIDYESQKPKKTASGKGSIHFGEGLWYAVTNDQLVKALNKINN